MIKLTESQKTKYRLQRLEGEELKRRKDSMFPVCVELQMWEECKGVTKVKIKNECKICPYYDKVIHMEEIKKEIKNAKKQLSEEEYEKHLKETLDEDAFNEWKESKKKVVKKEVVKEGVKHKKGVANEIRELAKKGVLDEDKIYDELKDKFVDRTEDYLRSRIESTIEYLRKRREIE